MKKILRSIIMISTIILTGCAKKQETKILFDTYILPLTSYDRYQESNNNLQNSNILKIYITSNNQSGFKPSLLIAKEVINTGTSLETFVAKNSNNILQKIGEAKNTDEDDVSLPCKPNKINAKIKTLQIQQDKQTLYTSQLYFIQGEIGYIISSMTDNNKENKNFISSFKGVSCLEK